MECFSSWAPIRTTSQARLRQAAEPARDRLVGAGERGLAAFASTSSRGREVERRVVAQGARGRRASSRVPSTRPPSAAISASMRSISARPVAWIAPGRDRATCEPDEPPVGVLTAGTWSIPGPLVGAGGGQDLVAERARRRAKAGRTTRRDDLGDRRPAKRVQVRGGRPVERRGAGPRTGPAAPTRRRASRAAASRSTTRATGAREATSPSPRRPGARRAYASVAGPIARQRSTIAARSGGGRHGLVAPTRGTAPGCRRAGRRSSRRRPHSTIASSAREDLAQGGPGDLRSPGGRLRALGPGGRAAPASEARRAAEARRGSLRAAGRRSGGRRRSSRTAG